MHIGFIATRLAGVDGVSLETAKLVQVFEEMGHQCFYCAGELDSDAKPGWHVPAMHFYYPPAQALHDEVFRNPTPSRQTFREIYRQADVLRQALEGFIEAYSIDLIVPQNASTIPMNIPLGIAIADVCRRHRIKTLFHHHDFYWERERFVNNGIQDILDDAFPPKVMNAQHMVISTVMQRRLKAWRGIDAHYLPNVFDFANPPAPPDDYALGFREDLGIADDDLILLQPTRIVRRKGIEKAIELVRKLNDDHIILVITGYEGDEPGEYGTWLLEEAERAGIRYRFIGNRITAERGINAEGEKTYTLWDVYPHAHMITYPSTYEGFGNALIETLYFRKPFIVHRYPAYLADIKSVGVRAVDFYHDLTEDVLAEVRALLDNPTLREDITSHNYQVGQQHFSYDVLRKTLSKALSQLTDEEAS